LARNGSAVPFTTQTIKGISYAFFPAATHGCVLCQVVTRVVPNYSAFRKRNQIDARDDLCAGGPRKGALRRRRFISAKRIYRPDAMGRLELAEPRTASCGDRDEALIDSG
jgi:hypothetical protein